MLWAHLVELLQALIFSLAHLCNGSVGLAVALLSFVLRLALLPLTIRLARRALDHQRRLVAIRPELERLQRRYANDPAAQWRETAALYRRRGIRMMDPAGLLGGLAQAPFFAAMFAALRRGIGSGARFLWLSDLAVPNAALTFIVAAVAVTGVALMPSADPARRVSLLPLVLTAGLTVWFLSSTSALFALSSGAGSVVNVLQAFLLRRTRVDKPVAA